MDSRPHLTVLIQYLAARLNLALNLGYLTLQMPVINWDDSINFENATIEAIKDFLHSPLVKELWLPTHSVRDVRKDPRFQKRGIDLFWNYKFESKKAAITVEVKADSHLRTGNVFLETVSDVDRDVPGCFLTCEASWCFYYFARAGDLFCLPVNIVRPWFLENMQRFKERSVSSHNGRRRWHTKGRLVPIRELVTAVPSVWQFRIREEEWCLIRSGAAEASASS